MGKPETETDLKALLTARRVERANQYNQLKLLPKTPDNIKLLDDTIVRGKRIRAAIDFLDGKGTIGDMDTVTAERVVTAIFNS